MGRSFFRLVAQALGVALFVFGAMWALQGGGLLDWPPNSFMLGESQWVLIGATACAIGAGLLLLANKMGGKS